MHGIILNTIQQFVRDEYGEEAWREAVERTDVARSMYVPMEQYPDEHVYALAETAGELTGLGARTFLVAYGRYVVTPLVETYGVHLDGDWDAMELIANVADFHAKLRTHSFSEYTPPEVRTGWADDETVHVEYDSYRRLCDVARGAIAGTADHFGVELAFTERTCLLEGDEQCRFAVQRVEPGTAEQRHWTRTSEPVAGN
jgi:predicted hydrocarbon binding protein